MTDQAQKPDALEELRALCRDDVYFEALRFVLAREGVTFQVDAHGRVDTGRVNNANDPGGRTNYGITQRVYDAYRRAKGLELRSVYEIEPIEVVEIYHDNYWQPSCASYIGVGLKRPRLALAHFDCVVNMGLVQGARCLQRALGVKADGDIGGKTLAAVKDCDETSVIDRYLRDRAYVYRQIVANRPASAEFLKGWLARCRWVARVASVEIDTSYAIGSERVA